MDYKIFIGIMFTVLFLVGCSSSEPVTEPVVAEEVEQAPVVEEVVEGPCSGEYGLELVKVTDKKLVCIDRNSPVLEFYIQNTGKKPLDGLRVEIATDSRSMSLDMKDTFYKVTPKGGMMQFTSSFKAANKVTFTPLFEVEGEDVACPEKALVAEDVEDC